MIGHLRVRSPLSQLAIFLGLLGAAFIIASMVMAVVIVSLGLPMSTLNKLDWSAPETVSAMKLIQALSSLLIFLVPALGFAFISFRARPLYFLGLKPASRPQMLTLAIVCMLVAFPFVFWLGELNRAIPLPEWMSTLEVDAARQMQAFLKADSMGDVLINVFVIALLPAVCEELCFRGALQRIMIHLTRHPWIGILVTAILFSAFHLQFQGFLPRMFLGVLLGAIYWYSGSLWPAIAAHFVTNAVQVVAVSYAPEYIDKNPSVPLLAALVSGVAVAGILWYIRSISTASYEKEFEPEKLSRSSQFIA